MSRIQDNDVLLIVWKKPCELIVFYLKAGVVNISLDLSCSEQKKKRKEKENQIDDRRGGGKYFWFIKKIVFLFILDLSIQLFFCLFVCLFLRIYGMFKKIHVIQGSKWCYILVFKTMVFVRNDVLISSCWIFFRCFFSLAFKKKLLKMI